METGAGTSTRMRLWAFTPFVAVLVEGVAAPFAAARLDPWLGQPSSTHFTKRTRRVAYPVSDRSSVAIQWIYRNSIY